MEGQRVLLLRDEQSNISDSVVCKCVTFKDALRLCKELSGLTDLQITQELDIDPAQWSRIWQSKAHFPDEKLERFMAICGNLVPLRWLAYRFRHGLAPLKEAWEIENETLRAALADKERELDIIRKWEGGKR